MRMNKKGAIFLTVLGTILVVVVLANVVLHLILNQAKLTHHQIARIQAYYAAQAGLVYAWEQLRAGDYTIAARNCESGCDVPITQSDFKPFTLTQAKVFIIPEGSAGCLNPPQGSNACISSEVTYTTD